VDASIACPAPTSAVFEVLKDNRRGSDWLGNGVTSVEPTSDPEHGVGSTRTVTFLHGLGKLEERFIGWEEPTLWSFTATSFRPGIFSRFVERVRIEPLNDGSCHIVYRLALDFRLLARPLAPIVVGVLSRAIRPTLARMSQAAVERRS
jgi:Polyketide cyclase / dehydrase and lipid transport.